MTEYVDIAEFRRLGYLQELNRQFLHPLGMALEVDIDIDGTERLGGVWDSRDDPEGFLFAWEMVDDDFRERTNFVMMSQEEAAEVRSELLGFVIQPLEAPDA